MTRQEYNRKILGLEKRIRFFEGIIKQNDALRVKQEKVISKLKEELSNEKDKGKDLSEKLSKLEVMADDKITGEKRKDGTIKLTDARGPVQLLEPTRGKISSSQDTRKTTPKLLKRGE